MKKLCLLFLSISMIVTTAICFASGVDVKSLSDEQLLTMQSEIIAEIILRMPKNKADAKVAGKVGDYIISINDIMFTEDYNKNLCAVVSIEWTNNSSKTTSFFASLSVKGFQNGIQLDTPMGIAGVNPNKKLFDVKPHETLEIEYSLLLRDSFSPIELEISESFNLFGENKLEASFVIP